MKRLLFFFLAASLVFSSIAEASYRFNPFTKKLDDIGDSGSSSAGGNNKEVQYNNSGASAGMAGVNWTSLGQVLNASSSVEFDLSGINWLKLKQQSDCAGTTGVCVDTDDNKIYYNGTTSAGTGDIIGPSSATDNSIVRFDSTTGKLVQGEVRGVVNYDDEGVIRGSGYRTQMISTPTAPSGVDAAVAGNPNGAYKYKVSYYTTNAAVTTETDVSSASGTVTVTNSQITVTIPTSSDARVKGRRIYRTLAGGSVYYFLANVSNNTATTYTDNIADSTISSNAQEHKINTTGLNFWAGTAGSTFYGMADTTNTTFGDNSGVLNTFGWQNAAFGATALRYNTTGINNSAFGQRACSGAGNGGTFVGDYNSCFGRAAGDSINTATRNNFIGAGAGFALQSGDHNDVMGVDAMNTITSASDNIAIGYHAVRLSTSLKDVIAIGTLAAETTLSLDKTILIGHESTATSGISNAGCLGYGCDAAASNTFNIGTATNYLSVRVRPKSAQTIAATNTITADACLSTKFITSAGAVTTSTTDTFTTPSEDLQGCRMNVINTGANNITLDANTNFKTSAGGDLTLTQYDSVEVSCDGTFWYQAAPVVANA